ncbi:MAG: FAD-binding oxidoreductase [Ignavibacteriales bacterium]|nr:FAD-binding oxidoreductase [Ignavibacteriales bacterium]
MLTGNYQKLYNELNNSLPKERLTSDNLLTLTYGTDAGFYRLIPKLVVTVENEEEAIFVIKKCNHFNIPITFRAAGTSLSGQSITDSVLMRTSRDWNKYEINDGATKIKLEAGVIAADANDYLKPFNKKIGPDPASIDSAMISGVAANNASGMSSGIKKNIDNTFDGMRIIFANGAVLDTTDKANTVKFFNDNSEFVNKVLSLSQKVKSNTKLAQKIKHKYSIKNTTGYNIRALVDYEDPLEIIQHLLIGSEGTLGFISEVTLNTVDEPPMKATSLMFFKDIKTACQATAVFKNLSVDASELMDRTALRSVQDKPGMPDYIKDFDENVTALLVETSSNDNHKLAENIKNINDALLHLPKVRPIEFTTDENEYNKLWDVRKGLFPSVCSEREPGTTVIIEDVNFHIEQLADGLIDLQGLFKKHNYRNTIIFGHSIEGNIHFVFSQNFNRKEDIEKYKNFMEDVCKLIIEKYDGSLKAEHGTGRNMAPFVEYEWGSEAYKVMKEIKEIFDPKNILNPGVIMNDDKEIHLKNLKPMPLTDDLIDKCIECGFCERNCPSKNLTLTPRQRIVAWREINRLSHNGDNHSFHSLKKSFKYFGNQTCAVDGLCQIACPVEIDTGDLIKKIRASEIGGFGNFIALFFAKHMRMITRGLKFGLGFIRFFQKIFGDKIFGVITNGIRILSFKKIPAWNKFIPGRADKILPTYINEINKSKVVYFPSCITRSMGLTRTETEIESLTTVTHNLLVKANYDIIYPEKLSSLCCGMPFSSKGFFKIADYKSKELVEELLKASRNGEYPVLFDTSPCAYTIIKYLKGQNKSELKIYEPVEFIHDFLMDKLEFTRIEKTVAVHVTCTSVKMGLNDKFRKLAEACVTNVVIPPHITCCGFAGDRGFTFPELTASALKNLKSELPKECKEGYSNSKTCEIGLSLHSGFDYKSIIYLVNKCTRAKR